MRPSFFPPPVNFFSSPENPVVLCLTPRQCVQTSALYSVNPPFFLGVFAREVGTSQERLSFPVTCFSIFFLLAPVCSVSLFFLGFAAVLVFVRRYFAVPVPPPPQQTPLSPVSSIGGGCSLVSPPNGLFPFGLLAPVPRHWLLPFEIFATKNPHS